MKILVDWIQGRDTATGILALLLVCLLAGCAVGPDYVKPDTPERQAWLEQENTTVNQDDAGFATWWKVFNDPVLDALIEEAYRQNLDLQVAGLRVLEARAQLGIAAGLLFPQQQSAGGSYSRVNLSENNTNNPFFPNYDDYNIGFDAAWELDFWGKFRRGIESGIGNLESSIAGYDNLLVILTAEVARAYVRIRTLEEQLVVARDNVIIQQHSLRIANARFEGGQVSELDVTQASALLYTTEATIADFEKTLRQVKNGLATLLGKLPGEVDGMLTGPGKLPDVPGSVAVGLPAELLRRRPDIRQAERQLAAQSALIGVAKADLFPHFFLFGSIGWQAGNANDWFESASIRGVGGPGFSWDIFSYGRITNNVRVQDARFQALAVQYENTVLKAFQETEDSLISFLRTREQAALLHKAVQATQRSVDLAMVQYKEGLADYQRVLDTQRSLIVQQDLFTATNGNVVLSLVSIYKSLGGGWQIREGKPFVDEAITEEMRQRTNWGDILEPAVVEEPVGKEHRAKPHWPDW